MLKSIYLFKSLPKKYHEYPPGKSSYINMHIAMKIIFDKSNEPRPRTD